MSIRSDIVDALDTIEDEVVDVEYILKIAIRSLKDGDLENAEEELEDALKIVTELLRELY